MHKASLKTYLPVAIALVSAAALSVGAANVAVQKIEEGALDGLERALAAERLDWVRVRVDGLQVELEGTAPDEAARFDALATAGTVIDATRIIDLMDVTPGKDIEAPEFSIEILRNLDGVSLIGLIPASTDRTRIAERIGRISETPITDLMETADYPVPDTWNAAVDFALAALSRVPRSKVSVSAERVAVSGIVDSEQVKRRIETELARGVPAGVRLALDISAPRPVIAPFTVRFLIDESGARFNACSAETVEMQRAILAAARDAGATGRLACQIGLGAPSLEWDAAAAASINALARIGRGAVTLTDADVSLVVPHTVPLPDFEQEVGALERALPEGFSLAAVRTPAPEETETSGTDARPEFVATLSPEGTVQLRGRLPDARVRTAVEAYAKAHFGSETTYGATRLSDGLPSGWSLKVLAALDALAWLASGSVHVEPGLVRVSGRTGVETAQGEIAGLLAERLGQGANFEIDVTYEEALDPLSGLPTPEECVSKLNTVLSVQKITFDPGSSNIDAEGLKIIDQLAAILKECQNVRMEIAGHTDSQGRESMNLNLSQERANAVLNAIMARRVLTSNLVAKGYGEANPIADNDTEEGREANRRIEFTLVQVLEESEDTEGTQEAAEASDAGETGEGETVEQN